MIAFVQFGPRTLKPFRNSVKVAIAKYETVWVIKRILRLLRRFGLFLFCILADRLVGTRLIDQLIEVEPVLCKEIER